MPRVSDFRTGALAGSQLSEPPSQDSFTMKVSRAEYDRLLESSPSVDQDIIAMLNKRFNKDYPRVSKPIVCNVLREVRVYKVISQRVTSREYR